MKNEIYIHLKVALFVGIILNLINQGENIINLNFDALNYFKVLLTFFVPFAVSIYSATKTKQGLKKTESEIEK
ncbi:MAG: hypothetical protein COW71_06505 [Ignavibacteriales bacterium CG18_big_fil_WC_8_21_14_2_50_31_20]|nr:hypothetical protein [Ignavibacteria bacterium]PIQ09435.1 MAG: hypothetical protein COW71_06505 [Ignavibacteriales bacterium CG18_big_fil_WC_8_21_14_2_50_31_20]